jgi:hypothetical protein
MKPVSMTYEVVGTKTKCRIATTNKIKRIVQLTRKFQRTARCPNQRLGRLRRSAAHRLQREKKLGINYRSLLVTKVSRCVKWELQEALGKWQDSAPQTIKIGPSYSSLGLFVRSVRSFHETFCSYTSK